VFHKAAYCSACKVCEVECPFGAIKFDERKVIITDKCKRCENCIDMPKGCLVARSNLFITGGKNVKIKGLGNYRGFGFRQEWLQYYIELGDKIWSSDIIGKPKLDALKIWFREAEVTINNKPTNLGQEICRLGVNDVRAWAVILNNIAYNSAIIRWYIQNVEFNMSYSINDIFVLLGDDYKKSTKDNAIASIKETLKYSPIGIELGLGNYEMKGRNIISITRTRWSQPDAQVILYSLYKFAEKSKGYYSFTLTELMNDSEERIGISPAQIFGLERDVLKKLIQGLAWEYKEFISVAFNKDLDNIYLNRDKTSLDVVKMF
jgi:phosphoadenosine phosphosulfate reductase